MIGSSAVKDSRIWILGGGTYDTPDRPTRLFYNDVWHSPNGTDWTEIPDTPWLPRHAASVFIHRDALWMVTGNNMQSDVWRLDRT
ncbi:TPA: hypothetical protein DCE37_01490 [Candidatus Latescibacteria bacterium]|nr:hypothetical protein [Candidatus Latescibacterota bacterium]